MTAPGSNVTMLTCMSCAMSSESTNRVVAQRPSVPGMATGSTSASLVTKAFGAAIWSTGS